MSAFWTSQICTSHCQALCDPYCQSTWWLACMIASNDILSNPASFMPPMWASLFYTACCKVGGSKLLTSWQMLNFGQSVVMPNASRRVLSWISRRAIGTSCRVPTGHEPINCLVSEIFSIKVDNTQTNMSTDNEDHLKLSSSMNQYTQVVRAQLLMLYMHVRKNI